MTISEKLAAIQQEISVPKSQWNKFGGYSYRSCEDILAALKPLLKKYKCTLILSDRLEECGGRVHIKATALLQDLESNDSVAAAAVAAEAKEKKKSDEAQISGAASSYARKYALNGLFLLDDNKDPDSNEYSGPIEEEVVLPQGAKNWRDACKLRMKDDGYDTGSIEAWYKILPPELGGKELSDLSNYDWFNVYRYMTNEG